MWNLVKRMEYMIEERLYLLALFDFYGSLLTEKQQECLRMYLAEDFSLAEIGESIGISRQAVYDNIHRSEKAMEEYESKLGFVKRYRQERQILGEIEELIRRLRTADTRRKEEILERLLSLKDREREV